MLSRLVLYILLQKENRALVRMLEDERQRRACAVEERDAAMQDLENRTRSADGATYLIQVL